MKKENIVLIALLGAGIYYFTRKKRKSSVIVDEPLAITKEQFESPESTVPDATIDADKNKLNLEQAVEVAKNVAEKVKDAVINIKSGGKTRTFRSGKRKVKLTAANRQYFKRLRKKTGKKYTVKQQRAIKMVADNITAGLRFR